VWPGAKQTAGFLFSEQAGQTDSWNALPTGAYTVPLRLFASGIDGVPVDYSQKTELFSSDIN
jgi:hypothetical protein